MSVWVDERGVLYRGRKRFHLSASTLEELHAFAARVGVKRCWFHGAAGVPHYDITAEDRTRAIEHGAASVSSRELIRRWREENPALAPEPETRARRKPKA